MMKKYIYYTLLFLLLEGCSSNSDSLKPPAGLRPCCAFGDNLQAKFLGIHIPFFRIDNMLDKDHLGDHLYNDGSQSVLGQLFDWSKEKDGLVYTKRGGFIDIAHVRDTADYTFYLFKQLPTYLGSGKSLILPPELRQRELYFPKNTELLPINSQLELAALTAFQLAQWHEIAQWFGYESEFGISETVSAFSPEDLYSNMLGAIIAMQVLRENPQMDKNEFSQHFKQQLTTHLIKFGIVDKKTAAQKIKALDGIWWDSHKRLPDKWLVLRRSYDLALTLTPNWVTRGTTLHLTDTFGNSQPATKWLQFRLVATYRLISKLQEKSLAELPANLYKKIFTPQDFQSLANFAEQEDAKARLKISLATSQ